MIKIPVCKSCGCPAIDCECEAYNPTNPHKVQEPYETYVDHGEFWFGGLLRNLFLIFCGSLLGHSFTLWQGDDGRVDAVVKLRQRNTELKVLVEYLAKEKYGEKMKVEWDQK